MAGNILFIVLDQLRADCVNGALADVVDTPNLDRLRAAGTTFTNHHTVTVPCGPSRASMLTGQYAMNHRSIRNGTPLASHITNVAHEARKSGYEPLLFGYTDTSADPAILDPADPDLTSYEGLMPGFRELVEMRAGSNLSWLADLASRGYRTPKHYFANFQSVNDGGPSAHICGPAPYTAEHSETAFLATETIKALSVRRRKDWFAHVSFIKPHPPLVAPEPYNRMYAPNAIPKADRPTDFASYLGSHPFIEAFFSDTAERELYIGFDGWMDRLSDEDADALRAVYLGLVTEVDHHVGRLLDFIDQEGIADNTLVIVTSDHGEMLGDKRQWGKRTFHNAAYHVPLIIRDPRNKDQSGKTVNEFTESVDIAPTILQWIGQDIPEAMDGRSLLPLTRGSIPSGWRDYIFAELDFGDPINPSRFQTHLKCHATRANCAILREERYKLVHFNAGLPPLLFDLENDPGETTNLAVDPDCGNELYRLSARMLDHRMTFADQTKAGLMITDEGIKVGSRW